jgi:hypothetical protein
VWLVVEFVVEAIDFVVRDDVQCFQGTQPERIQRVTQIFPTTLLRTDPEFAVKCKMLNL